MIAYEAGTAPAAGYPAVAAARSKRAPEARDPRRGGLDGVDRLRADRPRRPLLPVLAVRPGDVHPPGEGRTRPAAARRSGRTTPAKRSAGCGPFVFVTLVLVPPAVVDAGCGGRPESRFRDGVRFCSTRARGAASRPPPGSGDTPSVPRRRRRPTRETRPSRTRGGSGAGGNGSARARTASDSSPATRRAPHPPAAVHRRRPSTVPTPPPTAPFAAPRLLGIRIRASPRPCGSPCGMAAR